jgi:hypothetical protein
MTRIRLAVSRVAQDIRMPFLYRAARPALAREHCCVTAIAYPSRILASRHRPGSA